MGILSQFKRRAQDWDETGFWWFEADDAEETREFFDHYLSKKNFETDDPAKQHPVYGSMPPMHSSR